MYNIQKVDEINDTDIGSKECNSPEFASQTGN